jgi:catechol 2,3-dioxygenase-like lactoylglutathione lyase family enzyme
MTHLVDLLCPSGSEESSRAFYRDLLGLVEIAKPPSLVLRGGCWFQGDGVELRLGVDPIYGSDPKRSTTLISLDLEGLAERLSAAGYPVTWDEDGLPVRGFRSVDPHGNTLVFSGDGRSR